MQVILPAIAYQINYQIGFFLKKILEESEVNSVFFQRKSDFHKNGAMRIYFAPQCCLFLRSKKVGTDCRANFLREDNEPDHGLCKGPFPQHLL